MSHPIKRCHKSLADHPTLFVLPLLVLVSAHGNISSAADTFSSNKSISDGQSLTSAGGVYKLGFFSPSNSSRNRYVAIWYNLADHDHVIVWVANRKNPLSDTSGVLKFGDVSSTNLVLVNGRNRILWSTNISADGASNITSAKLLDSGNLVLLQSDDTEIWSSFDQLTDTLLPQAEMTFDMKTKKNNTLTSWKSEIDPSPGSFTVGFSSDILDQGFIWVNGSTTYWRMGPWIGQKFIGIPDMNSGYSSGFRLDRGNNKITFRYLSSNYSDSLYILRLEPGGRLTYWEWNGTNKEWTLNWKKPEDQCDLYKTCGAFGLCNSSTIPICSCMRGFLPRSSENWAKGNFSGGCVRRRELTCAKNHTNNITTSDDRFLKLEKLKLPDFAWWIEAYNETICSWWCSITCECLAYAYVQTNCMAWGEALLDMRVFSQNGEDLYVKLHPSEFDQVTGKNSSGNNKRKRSIIIASVVAVLGSVLFSCVILFTMRRKGQQESKKKNDPKSRVITSQTPILGLAEAFDNSSPTEAKILDSLQYDLEKIILATENFSPNNKLGEGGFGQVYKGVLPGGQEIAVKRLSLRSRQGLKEFKNEVLLISKLQHRNLVRLLGYCINAEEKLLVYDFMPNKSLDFFLFGPLKEKLLDWSKRFHIIEGISQGLLYLHRDSRLRIVHRDLKASNILLDADLNPKISDFGTARIFGVDQILETNTVIGTHGYMPPEYAMLGHFSEKSDVYSFGVLILEIMSSARINTCYEGNSLNLLGYAWKLWKEGNVFDLVDASLRNSWPRSNAMKCITVALLCVQELAAERPSMQSVVSMLISDPNPNLPAPKEPAFMRTPDPSSSSNLSEGKKEEIFSVYGVTITELESR